MAYAYADDYFRQNEPPPGLGATRTPAHKRAKQREPNAVAPAGPPPHKAKVISIAPSVLPRLLGRDQIGQGDVQMRLVNADKAYLFFRGQHIGHAYREELGWVSDTPVGKRHYSNPMPVACDRIIFAGYQRRWGWDELRIESCGDIENFWKRQLRG